LISYNLGTDTFNYRTAAVFINENKVLLHRFEGKDYWVLPGGRAEMHESSAESLTREMMEELGTDIHIKRLLWINEYFFTHENGQNFHEIAFIYLADFDRNSELYNFTGELERKELDGTGLFFKWFSISEIDKQKLFPEFLKKGLRNLPSELKHLIIKEQ